MVGLADGLGVVGHVGLEQQQGIGPVRREPGRELLAVEARVAGGDHSLDAEPTGGVVIGVESVAGPGIVADHDVGTDPTDHLGHPAPLDDPGDELPVDQVQEDRILRPEHGRGSALLVVTGRHQRGRVLVGIPGALGSVGQHQVRDPTPRRGPLGQRGAGLELGVVGVRDDHQGAVGGGQVAAGGSARWQRVDEVAHRAVPVAGSATVPHSGGGSRSSGSSTSQPSGPESRTLTARSQRAAAARWASKEPGP